MKIIACLGNPDKQYARTRHNAGFIFGDMLADQYSITVSKKEFSALTGNGHIGSTKVLFLKPLTYMNNSGESVQKAMKYHDIIPEELIVLHDEIELDFGEIKYKFGGGHKGNNGIRSIMQHINSPDFHRIRIGVGRPHNPQVSVSDHVLSSFNSEEKERLPQLLPEITGIIEKILSQ